MRTCTVAGCNREHVAKGLCSRHWQRMRNNGTLEVSIRGNGEGTIGSGYIRHKRGTRPVFAHVEVVENALGKPLPRGAVIHHVDGNGLNNSNDNLVVCENRSYHYLLHVRQRAYEATGDPAKRKCPYCKQYDAVENMVSSQSVFVHTACRVADRKAWAAKRKSNVCK